MKKKEDKEYEEYEKLINSKFKQQKLPGWRPIPSMGRTLTVFFSIGIIFAGLGVLILLYSNEIVEIKYKYGFNETECPLNTNCSINLSINKTMKNKTMFYYRLDGFYQNHRRYVQSKSDEQLNGKYIKKEQMIKSHDCDPVITNKEMGKYLSIGNEILNDSEIAIPCGLMAKNYFNDEFYLFRNSDLKKNIINDTNISRKSDKKKFKNLENKNKIQWLDMEDEHFIVWMRPSPLPNFEKLYGRINEELKEGDELTLIINNNYNVTPFNGSKYFILKTINNFGGKNTVLAIGYIVFGGICIILGIIFTICYKAKIKKEK